MPAQPESPIMPLPGPENYVLVLHNDPGDTPDSVDVLAQREAVVDCLHQLGHRSSVLACSLDLQHLRRELQRLEPTVVFNLVESLANTDRLLPVVPMFLEGLGYRYTGSSALAILESSHKVVAKRRLQAAGLPTPAWWDGRGAAPAALLGQPLIVKSTCEHASLGLTDAAVQTFAAAADLQQAITSRNAQYLQPWFAEQFVDGREFNLSLLAEGNSAGGAVQVLPAAEIEFVGFPEGKPRIVGYEAKWNADAPEYQQTPRRFDFPASDGPLLAELARLARACWDLFGLSGYARVDFRVDAAGQPWILEVNANPCLAPDAGFAAAVARAGLTFTDALTRILAAPAPL